MLSNFGTFLNFNLSSYTNRMVYILYLSCHCVCNQVPVYVLIWKRCQMYIDSTKQTFDIAHFPTLTLIPFTESHLKWSDHKRVL